LGESIKRVSTVRAATSAGGHLLVTLAAGFLAETTYPKKPATETEFIRCFENEESRRTHDEVARTAALRIQH
jgi:hypothetical protein